MDNKLSIKVTNENFESIKHTDENGTEFWYARELQDILGYKEWRYFSAVLEKAQIDPMKRAEVLTLKEMLHLSVG